MTQQNLTKPKKKITWQISTSYITKIAILTALSFILYSYIKFPLPMIFPAFLDVQISELPALLAGFAIGPVSGCIVIILKCLIKFPFTSTAYAGEITDIILGIAFVLPASLIYKHKKSMKTAAIGITVGAIIATGAAVLTNRYISIPVFLNLFFENDWNRLLNMVRPVYKDVTSETFYAWYLGAGIVPFNLLRYLIVGSITFLVYKKLSKALHWDGSNLGHKKETKKEIVETKPEVVTDANTSKEEIIDKATTEQIK